MLGREINKPADAYAINGAINAVARQTNLCVIAIHHYNKGGASNHLNHKKAAGSFGMYASVRAFYQVEVDQATGSRFLGVSPDKNQLSLDNKSLAFRTTEVAKDRNSGRGYVIAKIHGWNESETINEVAARVSPTAKANGTPTQTKAQLCLAQLHEILNETNDFTLSKNEINRLLNRNFGKDAIKDAISLGGFYSHAFGRRREKRSYVSIHEDRKKVLELLVARGDLKPKPKGDTNGLPLLDPCESP